MPSLRKHRVFVEAELAVTFVEQKAERARCRRPGDEVSRLLGVRAARLVLVMSFGVLSVIVLAGLAGPLLGASGRVFVPVMVGELLAGLVLGASGFRWLNPDQPTTAFLADIGFAMLMFAAGMHVPIRHPALLPRIRRGALAALLTASLAIAAGVMAARVTHVGHPGIYAVVLASGSAAVLVPCLDEFGLLHDGTALVVAAQVALADVASIVAVPLVLRARTRRRSATRDCARHDRSSRPVFWPASPASARMGSAAP